LRIVNGRAGGGDLADEPTAGLAAGGSALRKPEEALALGAELAAGWLRCVLYG
jgi:hypothetical protein